LSRPGINGFSRVFLRSCFLFFFLLFTLSCTEASRVLGIPLDEAAVLLKKGDTSFIRQAQLPDDFYEAESRLKQLSVIHSAAPFYAGLLAGENKNNDAGPSAAGSSANSLEILLFCAALESSSLPARREAALKLIPLIFEIEDEKEVQNILDFLNLSKLKDRPEIHTLQATCF
jgi:hypothetical protein